MNYNILLDLATDIGHRLAMSGAETYRVEESIVRLLRAYGLEAEVFAIPNCMTVSMKTPEGETITRMRRIGNHGNDLEAVEHFSGLSRKICAETPDPDTAVAWYHQTEKDCKNYGSVGYYLGNFLGGFGFGIFFGGTLMDALCAGLCGILIGIVNRWMEKWNANQFFRILLASFLMAVPAYALDVSGVIDNADAAIIGALMILVPGLLFTNAMRDIIFGDTNSGTNRIVQVFMIAIAIALGTGTAWNLISAVWTPPVSSDVVDYGLGMQSIACIIGCVGFAILFNIHGPGIILCAAGGVLAWIVYAISLKLGASDALAYFFAAVVASAYSETMARIRKYPAISYLVVSIFPLIPGAGIYYTMNYAVRGDMERFAQRGMHTIAIAGAMAVGILLASTAFRMFNEWKSNHHLHHR